MKIDNLGRNIICIRDSEELSVIVSMNPDVFDPAGQIAFVARTYRVVASKFPLLNLVELGEVRKLVDVKHSLIDVTDVTHLTGRLRKAEREVQELKDKIQAALL